MRRSAALTCLWIGCSSCSLEPAVPGLSFKAATFNTGTSVEQPHDATPDDGYGSAEATLGDLHYGNGLAWQSVVDDVAAFFAATQPDVVSFQEIFWSGDCPAVPDAAKPGFVCETWVSGDPTVAELVLGAGYQIACNPGKPDKCLAVRTDFGAIRGCGAALCLDALDGVEIAGCGGGSRLGRAVVERPDGVEITLVGVHGTSGISDADVACRVSQFEAIFSGEDRLADGATNLVLGDFNTDPARLAWLDQSAVLLAELVNGSAPYRFLNPVGEQALPTYGGALNIDHVIGDADAKATCFSAGLSPGTSAPTDVVYFDHRPLVCDVMVVPSP